MGMFEKLLRIQKDLKCEKGQYNKFGKFNYRSCEDILEAVKPLCVREGVALIISDSIENIGGKNYLKATVALMNVEDDKAIVSANGYAREAETKAGMDDSQITGTASSYARKYALNALFAIDDTKDADSDETPQGASQKSSDPPKGKAVQDNAREQENPLTLKEAMQETIIIKDTEYRLGALREDQLDWIIKQAEANLSTDTNPENKRYYRRKKEAAQLIRREKYKSALEDEQGEIPFN